LLYIDAYSTAKFLFEQASETVPEIEISSHNGKIKFFVLLNIFCFSSVQDHSTNRVTIVYIPSHLYHIIFELLKVYFCLNLTDKNFIF